MPDPTVVPRSPALRATPRVEGWWARAFLRAVEESAFDRSELVPARALARSGQLGAVMVIASMASVSGPTVAGERVLAQVKVAPVAEWEHVVGELAREAGFVAELEAGRLSAGLVENLDQAGVELLPGPEDLEAACTCDSWVQPCRHSLALLYLLGWRIDADPYLLLLLRGRTREWLLEEVGAVAAAAAYARTLLRETGRGNE